MEHGLRYLLRGMGLMTEGGELDFTNAEQLKGKLERKRASCGIEDLALEDVKTGKRRREVEAGVMSEEDVGDVSVLGRSLEAGGINRQDTVLKTSPHLNQRETPREFSTLGKRRREVEASDTMWKKMWLTCRFWRRGLTY
jgi:hypothetical protein